MHPCPPRAFRVIAVGVTADVDMAEIESIASTPADVITVDDFATLQASLDSLVESACQTQPTIPTTPAPTMPPVSKCPSYSS
jgi:hypothetical protein